MALFRDRMKTLKQRRYKNKPLVLVFAGALLVLSLSSLFCLTSQLNADNRTTNASPNAALLPRSAEMTTSGTTSLSPNFIESLPTIPVVFTRDCAVQFTNPRLSLCINKESPAALHYFAIDVVTRLLEHRFECNASGLRIRGIEIGERDIGNCFWVQSAALQQHLLLDGDHVWGVESLQLSSTGVDAYLVEARSLEQSTTMLAEGHPAYLLPFLYQDFYPLPMRKEGVEPIFCFIPDPNFRDQETMDLSFLNNTKRLLLNRHWRLVLDEARFCDYIGASSVEGLVVADSIGVPAMIINKAASIQRTLHYENNLPAGGEKHTFGPIEALTSLENYPRQPLLHAPALAVHSLSAAQAITESFPFDIFSSTTPALGKVGVRSAESSNNKTLVIVIGSLRGGEASWQSLYRNLLDANSADLALMIGNITTMMSKKSVPSRSSMYQRATHVWTFPEYNDWSDAIDQIDGSQAWRTTLLPHIVPKRAGTLGGADGRPGSGAIIYMARYWVAQKLQQLNLTQQYQRFVLTRSDHYYACPQDLSKLDTRYMWVPTGEDYGKGITDRHLVCNRGHIIKALSVLPTFVQHPTRLFKNKLNANPESFLRVAWTVQSLWPHQIKRFPRTMFVASVPDDGTRWGRLRNNHKNKKNRISTAEGEVTVKYPAEYDFAACFCRSDGVALTLNANDTVKLRLDDTTWDGFTDARQQWECKIR